MTKITIIGAGSAFTKDLIVDFANIENLGPVTIGLVDIDADRLEIAKKLTEKVIQVAGKDWTVVASIDRKEVLPDSNFVINQIEVAGLETVRLEYEIPLKYGINQCIGDTLGPGGLFKTLRTLPAWLEIVRDIEQLCPACVILNYTNPMSAVTLATSRVTNIPVIGLCHSIQNTSSQLAEYLGVPYPELQWRAGGINHMSWFVELKHQGKDMYPILKEKMSDSELLRQDPVRLDAMKYLGAFVSESSGHFSEYIPYYRKRDDLLQRHCGIGYNGGTGFYANNWPKWREENDQDLLRKIRGEEPIDLTSSNEYAAVIIEAMVKNVPKTIYGSVPNRGLIDNLLPNGVVEVECRVDGTGFRPQPFGKLPEHLATLCRSNMAFFELAVSAVLEGNKELALQALFVDPLTAAVCSLEEIEAMFGEMYEAERHLLSGLQGVLAG